MKSGTNLVVGAAKINIFPDRKALSADFFVFHPKRQAIGIGHMAIDVVFPLWAPD